MPDSPEAGTGLRGRGKWAVLALAAAGYALLLPLAARFDAGGLDPSILNRQAAIQRARELAEPFGIAADDWKATAALERDRTLALLLAQHSREGRPPGPAMAVSSLLWRVRLAEDDGVRELAAAFDAAGRSRAISLKAQARALAAGPDEEESAALAASGLEFLVGDLAERFEVVDAGLRQEVARESSSENGDSAPDEEPPEEAGSDGADPETPDTSEEDSKSLSLQLSTDGSQVSFGPDSEEAGEESSGEAASAPEATGASADEASTQESDWERLEIQRWTWKWAPPEVPGLVHRASLSLRGAQVNDLEWTIEAEGEAAPPAAASELRDGLRKLRLPLFLLTFLIYLAQAQRYFFPHRRVFTVGAVAFLLSFAWLIVTFGHRAFGEESQVGTAFKGFFDALFNSAGLSLALFGAGYVTARRLLPRQMESAELLLRGQWRSRKVGVALRDGVLLGSAVALVPYLVSAASGGSLLPDAVWPAAMTSRWPGVSVFFRALNLPLLGYLGAVVPLCMLLPWRLAGRLVAVLAGAAIFAVAQPMDGPLPLLLVTGALLAALFELLYHRLGMLTALIAGGSGAVASAAAAMVAQPGLRLEGSLTFFFLAGLGLLGGRLAAVGGSESLSDAELTVRRRYQAERERIKAQLSVAREAQMRMLPAAPPRLPGFAIAASCRPALEVGGDLYEFLPLGGGRWGLALGDVSGKWMVASLYMTLTKGLLLAASERSQELLPMLADVNRGLYQETSRNIFVTLWFGALDPAAKTLKHVRAGHNPALWRRADRGETVALRPRGFALGGTGPKVFDRLLVEEEIHLEPGDGLFIYSDGFSEAMNEDLEEYGDQRLAQAVARTDGMGAEQALGALFADVNAFVGQAAQHDDMTLIVIRASTARDERHPERTAPTLPKL